MKWPTSRGSQSAERVAEGLDSMIVEMLSQMESWRSRIAANSSSTGQEAQANYNRVMAVLLYVNASVIPNASGVTATYLRWFSNIAGFNPPTDWPPCQAALQDFVTWFQSAWPKTGGGAPAFHQYRQDGALETLVVPLDEATKTLVLAKLDAVLNAFN